MKARLALLLGLFLGGGALALVASAPLGSPERDVSYAAAQMAAGGNVYVLGASTETRCLHDTTGASTSVCDWYGPGELVVLQAPSTSGVTCVLSMTSTLTLGAFGGTSACAGTFGSSTFRNTPCLVLAAGDRRDQAIEMKVFEKKRGVSMLASGICINAAGNPVGPTSVSGEGLVLGCSANGDCTDQGLSGATCDTSLSSDQTNELKARGAVAIVCRGEDASAVVAAGAEQ